VVSEEIVLMESISMMFGHSALKITHGLKLKQREKYLKLDLIIPSTTMPLITKLLSLEEDRKIRPDLTLSAS